MVRRPRLRTRPQDTGKSETASRKAPPRRDGRANPRVFPTSRNSRYPRELECDRLRHRRRIRPT